MFYFVDEYSKLDGIWGVWLKSERSEEMHSTLLNAKRYCSKLSKCFGVRVGDIDGIPYSINFPIQLKTQEQGWYIHKKENILGTI